MYLTLNFAFLLLDNRIPLRTTLKEVQAHPDAQFWARQQRKQPVQPQKQVPQTPPTPAAPTSEAPIDGRLQCPNVVRVNRCPNLKEKLVGQFS